MPYKCSKCGKKIDNPQYRVVTFKFDGIMGEVKNTIDYCETCFKDVYSSYEPKTNDIA